MHKYLKIDLGSAVSISGIAVALTSSLFYDTKTVVISVLGTYFGGMIVDYFIFGLNIKRRVCVITGAFDKTLKKEVIAIVDKHEYRNPISTKEIII